MDFKISSFKDESLKDDEIEILIKTPIISDGGESKAKAVNVDELIEYIKQFENVKCKKIVVSSNNVLKEIRYDEIICFYSDKKYNYCRTKDENYKIKSKLYEIEKLDPNFIRISKACIVNIEQIKCFDLSETGQIVVLLNDGGREFVSRRKVKTIMELLDERSI